MPSENKFEEWLRSPNGLSVMNESIVVAKNMQQRGIERYSIGAVVEIVRYHRLVEGRDRKGFKINNDWRSLLARKIMRIEPGLSGFFATRTMKGWKA